jgi:hypothetical protein
MRGKEADAQRRKNAEHLQERRDQRSDQDQLQYLRERGHGHCAEAIKLEQRIEKKRKKK